MAVTKKIKYSKVESIAYRLDAGSIYIALGDYVRKQFGLSPLTQFDVEWSEWGSDDDLSVVLTQKIETDIQEEG